MEFVFGQLLVTSWTIWAQIWAFIIERIVYYFTNFKEEYCGIMNYHLGKWFRSTIITVNKYTIVCSLFQKVSKL